MEDRASASIAGLRRLVVVQVPQAEQMPDGAYSVVAVFSGLSCGCTSSAYHVVAMIQSCYT